MMTGVITVQLHIRVDGGTIAVVALISIYNHCQPTSIGSTDVLFSRMKIILHCDR